jgi:GAF domain/PilZ domain/Sel1 repeat
MAVISSALQPVSANRRRRVRHKIQTPAYASFTGESQSAMLDLHEIVDISEDGVAIQCHSPLELDRRVNLCLDLADGDDHIYTTGQVVWSNASGRAGLRFAELPADSISSLRRWLFVNVMAGVAHGEADLSALDGSSLDDPSPEIAPRPNYTDTLAAVSAVQRQVEALGRDLAAALSLISERALTLVRASGAAIALADADPDFMVCRASSGPDAPPVGARLQVGSGFSGECVKTGTLLRCDDAELDPRVDRESCNALGIRSILAAPVRVGEKTIGLLEVFCAQPNTFSDTDSAVLQRLAQTVLAAINRAARAEDFTPLGAADAAKFTPSPGSILFASTQDEEGKTENPEEKQSGVSLPLSHLIILVIAAALIFGVVSGALGYTLAPWIQAKLRERRTSSMPTVLASSKPPAPENPASPVPAVDTASLDQLRQMAKDGDPAAQNALGLRYATGDGVKLDESDAVRWFTRAAEQGNVAAQSKLGAIYYAGRGVPQDYNQAYFWMLLARANGDATSKALAPSVTAHLRRIDANSIERQADAWLQQRMATWKPTAGH